MNPVNPLKTLPTERLSQNDWSLRSGRLTALVVCFAVNSQSFATDATNLRAQLLPFLNAHYMDCHTRRGSCGRTGDGMTSTGKTLTTKRRLTV